MRTSFPPNGQGFNFLPLIAYSWNKSHGRTIWLSWGFWHLAIHLDRT